MSPFLVARQMKTFHQQGRANFALDITVPFTIPFTDPKNTAFVSIVDRISCNWVDLVVGIGLTQILWEMG